MRCAIAKDRCGSGPALIGTADIGPLSGVDRTLSLRTSATHPKAVGRPLIWAEKGVEMRSRGHLSVTRHQGRTVAPELWVNLWAGPYHKI